MPNPTYQSIMDHTESLLIEYNPSVLSYEDVLKMVRIMIKSSAQLRLFASNSNSCPDS